MKAPTEPARTHSWVCETWISQIFYVSVIVLLRFTQIFIRPFLSVEIKELYLVIVLFSL